METTFKEFFSKIYGNNPYAFQERFANSPRLPNLVRIPTGCGKTDMVLLGWLWRRMVSPDFSLRNATPRRLIYCLPMRVLVEQTYTKAITAIEKSGLSNVKVYSLMGGEIEDDFVRHPEQNCMIIGTQDMLISRALNRGYGSSRYRWPMDFGFLNNDCLWVFDETQLMGVGLSTSVQLAAFRENFPVFGSKHSLWMSATLDPTWLNTVDGKQLLGGQEPFTLFLEDKKNPVLASRLNAPKRLMSMNFSKDVQLIEFVQKNHASGSLTLVILNTVDRAQEMYRQFESRWKKNRESFPETMLIHSRFRPQERESLNERLVSQSQNPRDLILISTQVVEAGVDISARLLITELAPWPSLVQRFGRCNRRGEFSEQEAKICWVDVGDKKAAPYEAEDLKVARAVLSGINGQSVDPESLEKLSPPSPRYEPKSIIRKKDLIELFDTTPDLSGADIDISRYVRDEDDHREVQVFWRSWEGDKPPGDLPRPHRDELCSVSLFSLTGKTKFMDKLKKETKAPSHLFFWDYLDDAWRPVDSSQLHPGAILLIPEKCGGYDEKFGWTGDPKDHVNPLPGTEGETKLPESDGSDQSTEKDWMTLIEHTQRVAFALDEILKSQPDSNGFADYKNILSNAARWHDAGKIHPAFQEPIRKKYLEIQKEDPGETIFAKCPYRTQHERPYFRHELASALAFLQANPWSPENDLLNFQNSLTAFLIAAHHGKVRLAIRSMPDEKSDSPDKRFARGIWDGDLLPEVNLGNDVHSSEFTIDLELMELGQSASGAPSWLERTLSLRDHPHLGPFRLAFLEALFRAADWRASEEGETHA